MYTYILTQSFWTGTMVIRRKHIVQPTGLGACSSTCCQWDGEDVPAPWERSNSHPPVGIANSRWWGKLYRHSRRMCNPQFYVSGKRTIGLSLIRRVINRTRATPRLSVDGRDCPLYAAMIAVKCSRSNHTGLKQTPGTNEKMTRLCQPAIFIFIILMPSVLICADRMYMSTSISELEFFDCGAANIASTDRFTPEQILYHARTQVWILDRSPKVQYFSAFSVRKLDDGCRLLGVTKWN